MAFRPNWTWKEGWAPCSQTIAISICEGWILRIRWLWIDVCPHFRERRSLRSASKVLYAVGSIHILHTLYSHYTVQYAGMRNIAYATHDRRTFQQTKHKRTINHPSQVCLLTFSPWSKVWHMAPWEHYRARTDGLRGLLLCIIDRYTWKQLPVGWCISLKQLDKR